MPIRYREELKEILSGARALELVRLSNPCSHGWLRRPEYDTESARAWERPDGVLCGVVREGGKEATVHDPERRRVKD